MEQFQNYLIPGLIVGYFLWRIIKFKKVKAQIPDLLKQGALIIDVRTSAEYATGSRPGSLNIPLDLLEKESKKLDHSKPVILCCASGSRSAMAAHVLKKQGFHSVVNAGPWRNTFLNS